MSPATATPVVNDLFDISGAVAMTGADAGVRTPRRPDRPVQMVELSSIVGDSPSQTREVSFDPEQYEEDHELLESIKLVGLLQPIGVQAIAKGLGQEQKQTYRLVFGHRRTKAALAAGLEYVPALVYKPIENTEMLTLAENTGKRLLTSREKAMALIALRQNHPELDVATIAEQTGIPSNTVYQLLLALEKSVPALLELFAKNQWGTRTILELQPVFTAIASGEEQRRFAGELEHFGPSHNQIVGIKTMVVDDQVDPFAALMTMSSKNGTSRSAVEVFKGFGSVPVSDNGVAAQAELMAAESDEPASSPLADSESLTAVHEEGAESQVEPVADSSGSAVSPAEGQPPALHIEDERVIQSLHKTTGLPPTRIQSLSVRAVQENASMDALAFACIIAARTGDDENALRLGQMSAGNAVVSKLLKAYQGVFVKAGSVVNSLRRSSEGDELADLVSTVFIPQSDGGR